jgi:hypothetical protein
MTHIAEEDGKYDEETGPNTVMHLRPPRHVTVLVGEFLLRSYYYILPRNRGFL